MVTLKLMIYLLGWWCQNDFTFFTFYIVAKLIQGESRNYFPLINCPINLRPFSRGTLEHYFFAATPILNVKSDMRKDANQAKIL